MFGDPLSGERHHRAFYRYARRGCHWTRLKMRRDRVGAPTSAGVSVRPERCANTTDMSHGTCPRPYLQPCLPCFTSPQEDRRPGSQHAVVATGARPPTSTCATAATSFADPVAGKLADRLEVQNRSRAHHARHSPIAERTIGRLQQTTDRSALQTGSSAGVAACQARSPRDRSFYGPASLPQGVEATAKTYRWTNLSLTFQDAA